MRTPSVNIVDVISADAVRRAVALSMAYSYVGMFYQTMRQSPYANFTVEDLANAFVLGYTDFDSGTRYTFADMQNAYLDGDRIRTKPRSFFCDRMALIYNGRLDGRTSCFTRYGFLNAVHVARIDDKPEPMIRPCLVIPKFLSLLLGKS